MMEKETGSDLEERRFWSLPCSLLQPPWLALFSSIGINSFESFFLSPDGSH